MGVVGSSFELFAAYLLISIAFVVVFTVEVIAPASGNNCDKRWRIYAGAISAIQFAVAITAGFIFRDLFQHHAILPFPNDMPTPLAALLTFLLASFIAYWWHRATHNSDTLWRIFHQLHHSPERVEALTAFYVHPFDGLAAVLLNSIVAYGVFGATPEVAALAIMLAAVYNIYIHSDTKSPHWLGAIIQRPEMHRVHHKADHHADNYGLPIWDIIFGTFTNPQSDAIRCGFAADKQKQIKDMLLFRDVSG